MRQILKQLIIENIHETVRSPNIGIQNVLESGNFFVTTPSSKNNFIIFLADKKDIAETSQYEISRFTCAAMESLQAISTGIPYKKSSGWAAIKLYYAAFYSANAIMRFFGQGITNLDRRHTKQILENSNKFNTASAEPNTGTFHYSITGNQGEIQFTEILSSDGSHGKFWAAFTKFLDDLKVMIGTSTATKDDMDYFIESIENLLKIIKFDGCNGGNWLSQTRNKINYRFEYGLWYPNNNLNAQHSLLFNTSMASIQRYTTEQLNTKKDKFTNYFSSCNYLIFLCIELNKITSGINVKKAHFSNKHTMPLIKNTATPKPNLLQK